MSRNICCGRVGSQNIFSINSTVAVIPCVSEQGYLRMCMRIKAFDLLLFGMKRSNQVWEEHQFLKKIDNEEAAELYDISNRAKILTEYVSESTSEQQINGLLISSISLLLENCVEFCSPN